MFGIHFAIMSSLLSFERVFCDAQDWLSLRAKFGLIGLLVAF
jgi:hypothetical protein